MDDGLNDYWGKGIWKGDQRRSWRLVGEVVSKDGRGAQWPACIDVLEDWIAGRCAISSAGWERIKQ